MRRLLTATVPLFLMLAAGCVARYDKRMDNTIAELKYDRELNKNLEPAPSDGPLKALDIYLRPPKGMQSAKEFLLGAIQPGLFDVERSFHEGQKDQLHVLARKKMPKKPPAKGAAPAEPPAARGEFNADVLAVLKAVFGDDENIAIEKFKEDKHRGNTFRRNIFTATVGNAPKKVEVFLTKVDPYDVALIYVFDQADEKAIDPKIRLSLESFALGDKAKNKYSGASDTEAETAAQAAAPMAF